MDLALRTPLLDLFQRSEAPRDVRLLAARGGLAPRAHEQLLLLALLVDDPDAEIREAADATIDRIPRDALAAFLARPDAGADLREFFGRRGVEPAPLPADAAEEPLVEDATAGEAPEVNERRPLTALSVTERMKVAMRGRREERAVLVRDPNRLVASAVLSSPKLTDAEIESFARMSNVSEEVLRIIGTSRAWVKKYPVAAALARNPKTPIAVSMPLVSHLVERDVKQIALDRNAPEPLRIIARKILTAGQARKR